MSLRFCPFKSFFFFWIYLLLLYLCVNCIMYVKVLRSSGRLFPLERLMKCSGQRAKGAVVPCWDFTLTHWAHHSHTGYIIQSAATACTHARTHAHTHTHTGLAVDNIRAVWVGRNRSCFNSCPNGWYRVAQVSLLLQGPPLTCCYIMLACVLFGSVWYSVVG